ncbi:biotin carboxyl carrier protein of acetyl-CoA carboxylase 2, chloroplastic [Jatropha curcas]|uniref:Biotin carboxyl carrier protein of acetyl-CoA carboxylase n=2 Tax=Jatropha curcas TaxID=180498 RepID=C7E2U1_JATCU|nr:biotin carboxyl carrier protein of acetyl-CoA carboxylase 2, chloroplastic [Jatropha curcas]ACT33948.1 biotin carboxyl carrier protein subunit [Jatropha curcas]
MASISVPCPKTTLVARIGSNVENPLPNSTVSFPPLTSNLLGFQWCNWKQSRVTKMQAKLNEVLLEKSSNSVPVLETNSNVPTPDEKDESTESNILDASQISAFMTQVSDLVKLVDSRDITELQLKQLGCQLIIRKKEALQQPPPAAPVIAMPPSYQHTMLPSPPPAAPASAPPSSPPLALALPPPAKTSSSSHPPLKCPMAGTFYRNPAPGEPPFVKVGDKVQKGQVVCIIEAMKLMNEIEADQAGTIAEILVEDGKPVSVDMPLFVIAP